MITVQWSHPVNDSSRGHIFYRRFCCGNDSITRVYSSSDFILFSPPLTTKLYVAEILSAWKTVDRNFVSLRIYAKPQDTECGRLPFHGEDELLVLSKIIVITCEQLFQFEHLDDAWRYGTPLNTRYLVKQEQEPSGLMCTERMLPIDKDCLVFNGVNNELTLPRVSVIVVDFQSYCRHKAIAKRIGNNPALLASSLFAAMGGILGRQPGTFLVFCRKAYHDNRLESLLSCEGLMIRASVLKGVPSIEKANNQTTKRGESEERDETWEPPTKKTFCTSEDASPTDNGYLDNEEFMYDSPADLSPGGPYLCKKRRSRPQKCPQASKNVYTINLPVTKSVITDNYNVQPSILIPTCDFSFQAGNGYSDGHLSQDQKEPASITTADYLESCMLKSHLIQQSDEDSADKMNENRKEFFESLFTFMIGRNTPITRIPLLGFKKLDLYELFHLTNKLGGYEQVTLSNKWKSVFNALGGKEITAAATYTRKHYEKYLLAYEKEVYSGKWMK